MSKEKNALNIEVEALKIANEKMYSSIEATKAEIFEEIEEYFGMYNVPIFLTRKNFAELKKKYTVETNEHNERTD